MKKLIFFHGLLLSLLILLAGCDNSSPTGSGTSSSPASGQRQFVWNAMNYWYYWQSDVPELADNHQHFSSDQAFQDYLKGFANPDSLFQSLRYKPGNVDQFSYFIPDYKKYNNQNKGIYAALGFNYGYVVLADHYTVIGYVQYIVPGSPADSAGLKRGTVFWKVDGNKLNVNNYQQYLRDDQSPHTLTLAKVQNNTIVQTDSTVTIQSRKLTEDPVFYHTVIDTSNTKIGYLVYNAFQTNSHKELNKVFGTFASKGINTLILDLRYNGGGSLLTSEVLGSMISGKGPSDEFAELSYNSKRSSLNSKIYFLNKVPIANSSGTFDTNSQGDYTNTIPMNKLSINNVYILISQSTASASEALINALKPYMNVTLVGTKTIGKNHGEITLYDEPKDAATPPYTDVNKANPNTKFALAPLIFKITNKNHNDYPNGFKPDIKVDEVNYLGNLPPLGSLKDPLVSKAISQITGGQTTTAQSRANLTRQGRFQGTFLKDNRDLRPHGKEMNIPSVMLKKIAQRKKVAPH